jgi:ferrous-iron efflux pump FieF
MLHSETHGFREGERIAQVSVWTLLAVGILELVFSSLTGSIALFADGVDSISDAVVSFFVWTGLRFVRKRPSRRFQYGYYKVESLTALATAIILVGFSAFIFARAYRALNNPQPVNLPVVALVVLMGAGLISLYRALQMRRVANRNNILSLKVDARNSIKDTTSSFVAFASVLVASFGIKHADAIGGMLVGVYILTVAYVAIKESSLVLLDAFHEPELTKEIENLIKSRSDVSGIRELRLRRAGPFIVGAIEVIVDGNMSVNQAHEVATQIENSVKSRIAGLRRLVVTPVPLVDPHEHFRT